LPHEQARILVQQLAYQYYLSAPFGFAGPSDPVAFRDVPIQKLENARGRRFFAKVFAGRETTLGRPPARRKRLMHDTQLTGVVGHLRRMAGGPPPTGLTDRQLLAGFAAAGDPAAFAALVERHGPMVLRVCRRVLRQEQDAEDAFQATFLVLAAKAGSIRKAEALASWLHGVAHRVALRARRDAGRRRRHEREAQAMAAKTQAAEAEWHEVQAALDEEIGALPEVYRAPFVLCFLEGKSRAEAARELGLKEGTVWSRLSQARKRLHERLGRRGIVLPALLAVAALSGRAARATPARLIRSTVQAAAGRAARAGAAPARVVALAEGVSKAMTMTQLRTVVLCLVTAALVALGAGVVLKENAFARPPGGAPDELTVAPAAPPVPAAKPGRRPQAAIEEAGATVTFRGRVLDPDGKPLAGAEVTLWWHLGYWGFYREWHPETTGPFRPKCLATTGEDGRFTATFRKSEVTENPLNMWERPWRLVQVVVAAKGYGPAWASLESLGKEELTLRLAKDEVPVKGRVLDLEGRPVVGAAVHVVRVGEDDISSLWQPSWTGLSGNVTTDKEGRFSLSGVGRGREVLLSIEGARVEHKLVLAKTPATGAGPAVEVVAKLTKPIEGTVRVKGTGKPLAGVVVYGEEEAHHRRVRAVTDERGRYRLVGLAKAASYRITVYPPLKTGCLRKRARVADTEGLRPVTADVEVRRGVELQCRLIDRVTRESVRGEIRYTPLRPNPLYGEAGSDYIPTDEFERHRVPGPDGVFRFVAYAGPGLLVVILQSNQARYLPRPIDPADLAKARGDMHMEWARLFGMYRLIDPKDGDKPLAVDIELDPGRKATGSLVGPDGKPISGATAYGLDRHFLDRHVGPGVRLKADTFTASVLDPQRPRTVSFVHKERRLIGRVELRGDEKGPVTVPMEPWGVLTGRLVDGDGRPVAGARLGWHYPSVKAPGLLPPAEPFTTDAEGRFRVEGLAPGVKFEITLSGGAKKVTAFSAGAALKGLSLEPGQTKDLGDVRVKAAPTKKGGNDE
jgi:RNA polymerase sigma factor (sigma-70 family)